MKKNENINKKLIDLLLKKASGFHYVEQQLEYEREKGAKTSPKTENLNFFDICDRGKSVNDNIDDMMSLENETKIHKADEGLILVKKKVSSHYIPPDMLAIKILLEMFGKKEVDDVKQMTDDELFKFKEKILEEIKNENNIWRKFN